MESGLLEITEKLLISNGLSDLVFCSFRTRAQVTADLFINLYYSLERAIEVNKIQSSEGE